MQDQRHKVRNVPDLFFFKAIRRIVIPATSIQKEEQRCGAKYDCPAKGHDYSLPSGKQSTIC